MPSPHCCDQTGFFDFVYRNGREEDFFPQIKIFWNLHMKTVPCGQSYERTVLTKAHAPDWSAPDWGLVRDFLWGMKFWRRMLATQATRKAWVVVFFLCLYHWYPKKVQSNRDIIAFLGPQWTKATPRPHLEAMKILTQGKHKKTRGTKSNNKINKLLFKKCFEYKQTLLICKDFKHMVSKGVANHLFCNSTLNHKPRPNPLEKAHALNQAPFHKHTRKPFSQSILQQTVSSVFQQRSKVAS